VLDIIVVLVMPENEAMTQDLRINAVSEFYDMHPINEQQIMEKLRLGDADLSNVTEDVLQDHDQDHFGGIAANDALASLANIDESCHVLDLCSGMGGPSRYLAHNYRCKVTGIDLTESRVKSARRLTKLTGLDDLVTFEAANALDLPFADETFDVVISQEAFCHIPDKARLLAQCARVLKRGGRLAFTDILATDSTDQKTRNRLKREMTFQELGSTTAYREYLERNECGVKEVQDVSDEWRDILVQRLAMYRSLKDQTVERFGEAHFIKWDAAYSFFVGLYQTGNLGGARFLARRNDGV